MRHAVSGIGAEPVEDRDAVFMGRALELARRAGLTGQAPVGACIVRNGQVIASGANAVVAELDVTAHAEVVAIRAACRAARLLDLSDCEMYTTVQPCPMCLTACHYAHIRRVVYAVSLAEMHAITGRELLMPGDYAALAPQITLRGGCRREQALLLLRQWADSGGAR